MRVQQKRQTLRARIGEAELGRLLDGETVVNETCWPDGRREQQGLSLASALAWQRQSAGWQLQLPRAEVEALAGRLPSREGLIWSLATPAGPALEVRFDVDVRESTHKRYGKGKKDASP